jgi:hydrogenase-1 operon protein HyaF
MELMNAIPLLDEIRHALAALRERGERRVINIMNFPLTEGDSQFLDEALGRGAVTITYGGGETTFWREAKVSGVWWGEYRNAYHKVTLRTIEITDFPDLAKAQPEDIEDGVARIDEVINGQPANVARSLPVLPS